MITCLVPLGRSAGSEWPQCVSTGEGPHANLPGWSLGEALKMNSQMTVIALCWTLLCMENKDIFSMDPCVTVAEQCTPGGTRKPSLTFSEDNVLCVTVDHITSGSSKVGILTSVKVMHMHRLSTLALCLDIVRASNAQWACTLQAACDASTSVSEAIVTASNMWDVTLWKDCTRMAQSVQQPTNIQSEEEEEEEEEEEQESSRWLARELQRHGPAGCIVLRQQKVGLYSKLEQVKRMDQTTRSELASQCLYLLSLAQALSVYSFAPWEILFAFSDSSPQPRMQLVVWYHVFLGDRRGLVGFAQQHNRNCLRRVGEFLGAGAIVRMPVALKDERERWCMCPCRGARYPLNPLDLHLIESELKPYPKEHLDSLRAMLRRTIPHCRKVSMDPVTRIKTLVHLWLKYTANPAVFSPPPQFIMTNRIFTHFESSMLHLM